MILEWAGLLVRDRLVRWRGGEVASLVQNPYSGSERGGRWTWCLGGLGGSGGGAAVVVVVVVVVAVVVAVVVVEAT